MWRRSAKLLVEDIWEAVEKVERYVAGLNREAFVRDEKTADSVVRNLEIIGEASSRIPEDFKTRHCEIEWPKIIGLRNRIVHDYFSVDVEIIWQILQHDLPAFKIKLAAIREQLKT